MVYVVTEVDIGLYICWGKGPLQAHVVGKPMGWVLGSYVLCPMSSCTALAPQSMGLKEPPDSLREERRSEHWRSSRLESPVKNGEPY